MSISIPGISYRSSTKATLISPENIHFVTQLRLSVVSPDFDQKEIVDISNRIKCQYTFQDYCSTEAQPKYHIPPQNIDFKT